MSCDWGIITVIVKPRASIKLKAEASVTTRDCKYYIDRLRHRGPKPKNPQSPIQPTGEVNMAADLTLAPEPSYEGEGKAKRKSLTTFDCQNKQNKQRCKNNCHWVVFKIKETKQTHWSWLKEHVVRGLHRTVSVSLWLWSLQHEKLLVFSTQPTGRQPLVLSNSKSNRHLQVSVDEQMMELKKDIQSTFDRPRRSHLHPGSVKRRRRRRQSCLSFELSCWLKKFKISNHCHITSLWFSDFNIWLSAPQAKLSSKWNLLTLALLKWEQVRLKLEMRKLEEEKPSILLSQSQSCCLLSIPEDSSSWSLFCAWKGEKGQKGWIELKEKICKEISSFSFNSSTCATSFAALPLHWDL